ncbi:hypothetical protein P3X46_029015 [Hevea brasiliensis]|uniref:Anthocyanidin 3-O-glucosyltransferase n=1 Tax=Hevea brasiliensis TaxID=3981 RepID=A0ABQ9KR00_HEVBR|nr:hypothetical protein P3X46_029015 [Hevea brasiliensis]
MNLPFTPFMDLYTKSFAASQPNIRLIDLPQVDLPSSEVLAISIESFVCAIIESQTPYSAPVAGIVVNFFCLSLIDIGDELGLPSFIFLTSGAGFLSLMLYLPSRHEQNVIEFSISDPEVSIPGFANPVPPRIAKRFKDAKGIIVNTITELESYALESFHDGQNPKIYPVGPVLSLKGHPHPDMDHAHLEQSGYRFLWSMRALPIQNEDPKFKNPKEMLPQGFLERMEGRGMICRWAPQVEVLAYNAIGGFVSHWVPIVTLPIYAEQQLNAFTSLKELRLAVELKLDYRPNGDLARAEEVGRVLRCVRESDNEVRKKVKDMAGMARKAVMEGGSSSTSISELIKDVKKYV